MEFRKSKTISLKAHPHLQREVAAGALLAEDPTLLGLGDLEVKDIERRQPAQAT